MPQTEPSQVDLTIGLQPNADERSQLNGLGAGVGRAMRRALSGWNTAKDVAEQCELPTSTVYRQLEALTGVSHGTKSFCGHPGRGANTIAIGASSSGGTDRG